MTSSDAFVKSLLADILKEVMVVNENGEMTSSQELSFCSSSDHFLPCSADFQFFFSIAATAPPHSPNEKSQSYSGVTPPPSPQGFLTSSSKPSTTSSPLSPGVSLLPLSGQFTQAVPRVYTSHWVASNFHNEPARKKVKMENDNCDEEDYGKDDEMPPLPLTFTTPADLRWKLQKAEIIPSSSTCTNEESHRRDVSISLEIGQKHGEMMEEAGMSELIIENVKEEREDDFFSVEVADGLHWEKDVLIYEESPSLDRQKEKEMQMKACQSRPSLSKANLLNKPPRLGLSKLYRSSASLHDVSIIERIDRKNTQRELFLVEKEE